VKEGILEGLYLLREGPERKLRVQLMGSGAILREVIAAADLLETDFDVSADIWSATSFNELRRKGLEVERWNALHPEAPPRTTHIERCLSGRAGPVVAATDYMKLYADQIRAFVPRRYTVLGTDGFGRSDTRRKLRSFFEVDRYYIAVAALGSLAAEGEISAETVTLAMAKYGIDPEKADPVTL
jgi:pyruvate dehydrogenase E1 component